jgi:hypothetical protein
MLRGQRGVTATALATTDRNGLGYVVEMILGLRSGLATHELKQVSGLSHRLSLHIWRRRPYRPDLVVQAWL